MLALRFRVHCRMQFELDALIWPMLYIYSEMLIIDLTIKFCELYLFAYSQKMRFRG